MSTTTDISHLAAPDEIDRINAAEDLGYAGAPEGIVPLVERLVLEPSRKVRETIFSALDKLDYPEVPARVAALLDSPDAFLRNQAVGLLQRKGAAAVPVLLARAGDPDPDVRKFVLDAAAGNSAPGVEPIFDAAMADRDLNVVIAALEYAGEQRKSRFKPVVENILQTATEPMLVSAALACLLQIGDAASWAGLQRRYPTAASLPEGQLGWWIRVLGEFAAAGETELFHEVLRDHGRAVICDTCDALERFQARHGPVTLGGEFWQLLRDQLGALTAPDEKLQLLRVIGGFGGPAAIGDYLVDLLAHDDRVTRLGAIEGLKRLARPKHRDRLRDRLAIESDPEVAQALGACEVRP